MPENLVCEQEQACLTPTQERQKRAFDLLVAGVGVVITAPVTALSVVLATIDTREWGIFSQSRIGLHGKPFRVHKIRTMRTSDTHTTTVTAGGDPRITTLGRVLRQLKVDELPQLVDVLRGDMSIVGPRPDVAGWADELVGADRVVLQVRPGITGPASLAFRHEEAMLAAADDPEGYNREVIWPEKVRINRTYIESWTLREDLRAVWQTVQSVFSRSD
ncbi:sugar transferase [Flexivirga sp.]|uniref:sugar transferase n=1 Tax=Flexivirga sp. TaxID=1962927 RepID=UPI003F81A447